jgi:hypothetical protein
MKQAAFLIESPDERDQTAAEYFARVQESLNIYAVLVNAVPKD